MKRLLAILLMLLAAGQAQALTYIETPSLAADVAAGKLPPVALRVPSDPAVEQGRPGQPGGELRVLIGSPRDTRLLAIIGYARLMAYTPNYDLVPDMLASVDQKDQRVYTLHLRPGHRWSDGAPFTSEASLAISRHCTGLSALRNDTRRLSIDGVMLMNRNR